MSIRNEDADPNTTFPLEDERKTTKRKPLPAKCFHIIFNSGVSYWDGILMQN